MTTTGSPSLSRTARRGAGDEPEDHLGEQPTASIDAIGVEPGMRRNRIAHELFEQLRRNMAAIGATSIRTEVDWSHFELLAFLRSEGFEPAPRLCLERKVDPTE